ncbi:MAG TPA: M3 family metallopeptidase, partial [Luteimonas sp.]|nr:M3 family metallopeptidase [Luteimonas sp.]
MKQPLALALAAVLCTSVPAFAATHSAASHATTKAAANPFASQSTLPFHAPDFSRIKDADFAPAFDQGMRQQRAEVRRIADNPAAPTFDNTFVALEKSGRMLSRVNMTFNALSSANTDDALQKTQEDMAPKLAAHADAIYLDAKLFKRIETIYNKRDTLHLDPESKRLVEWYYLDFVHHGARLSDADKAKLKDLNKEESTLVAGFVTKLLAGTKAGGLVVDDKAKLAGLSDAEIDAAAQAAKDRKLDGKWVIPLQNTTQQPSLQSLTDRGVREQLFNASWTRTEKGDANDTRDTISRLAQVRAQQAKLLGYDSYAAWKLEDQMAKTPATALKFLDDLVPAATARARSEAADIQAQIDKDGGKFKLQPWDWQLYAEQVRKAKYDLDESQIKPYFELD